MADPKDQFPKAYDPAAHEDAVYAAWQESGFFNPDKLPEQKKRKEPFTIVMPPPNVTGTLHLGHAVMLAVEDLMVRFERMRGKRALWIPGTDHAAIATQTKVEKLLLEKKKGSRHELGREAFLKEVNAFASESHDTIVNQVKKMGSSCDWSREAYTLDGERSEAVKEAFRQLYQLGLLYRGDRVVNWCPRCQSTLADDEVEYKEGETTLFTLRYAKDFPIPIATTRPETKLGDTAVAVYPTGKYEDFVDKEFDVDFLGQKLHIRIVAERAVDPDFGTGALGVTPAHSQEDERIAREHDLPSIKIFNEEGYIEPSIERYAGLTVAETRKQVVSDLRSAGLIEKEETVPQSLSVCYRCGTAVEPLPKLQWFIGVNKKFDFNQSKKNPISSISGDEQLTLKEIMSRVIKEKDIQIVPERFEKTYFQWIDNLKDWCVSRQIWFGHRIPAWYHDTCQQHNENGSCALQPIVFNEDFEDLVEPVFCPYCRNGYSKEHFSQDKDTLDTWFSSGLWTFSTLGWPNAKAKDLATFHPTSVLETGYDILFFWIARMILMSTALVGEMPFKQVYLHGLVRDEQGRKMSKSLGNIIDPLDMIAKYGTDAVRLSLVIGSTPGNDVRLSEEKIAGFRNFTNKLWNIGRFVLTTTEGKVSTKAPKGVTLADRWILSRLASTCVTVTTHLEKKEFSLAGEALRDFTWNDFADNYIEDSKIQKIDTRRVASTDILLRYLLAQILRLWHPFMPFVTEVIWKELNHTDKMLIVSDWPTVQTKEDLEIENEIKEVHQTIKAILNLRSENNIPFKSPLKVNIYSENFDKENAFLVEKRANLKELTFDSRPRLPGELVIVAGANMTIYAHHESVEQLIGASTSQSKLSERKAELVSYISTLDTKLNNQEFTSKAPPAVIEKEKGKRAAAAEELEKILKQLEG